MRSTFCLTWLAAMLACGPTTDPDPEPPTEEEARQVIQAYCEQPVVPCTNEETGCGPEQPPDLCYTMDQCLADVRFFYDGYAAECQVRGLDLLGCQAGMTCEEAEDYRTGESEQCDEERELFFGAGCDGL